MYHPNSNSKHRGVKNLICTALLRRYRHGIPPETPISDNGFDKQNKLTIMCRDGTRSCYEPVRIRHNGHSGKLVAHYGQQPEALPYLMLFS